jgi:hypothetical protein
MPRSSLGRDETPRHPCCNLTAASWRRCGPERMSRPGDPEAARRDPGDDIWAAVRASRSGDTAGTSVPLPTRRSRPGRALWLVLLVAVWGALGAVDIVILGAGHGSPQTAATKAVARPVRSATATAPSVPAASATVSPSGKPTLRPEVLAPVGATAYGPRGPGSGDNSSQAALAIDESTATRWQSAWYRSAAFGNLQAGTGLLIDMGRPVTITSVQLILDTKPGADVQLLAGNTPERSVMRLQARADDAGARVSVRIARPKSARYLLIWFTLLPPDSTGTYQASVYNVRIGGTP